MDRMTLLKDSLADVFGDNLYLTFRKFLKKWSHLYLVSFLISFISGLFWSKESPMFFLVVYVFLFIAIISVVTLLFEIRILKKIKSSSYFGRLFTIFPVFAGVLFALAVNPKTNSINMWEFFLCGFILPSILFGGTLLLSKKIKVFEAISVVFFLFALFSILGICSVRDKDLFYLDFLFFLLWVNLILNSVVFLFKGNRHAKALTTGGGI